MIMPIIETKEKPITYDSSDYPRQHGVSSLHHPQVGKATGKFLTVNGYILFTELFITVLGQRMFANGRISADTKLQDVFIERIEKSDGISNLQCQVGIGRNTNS